LRGQFSRKVHEEILKMEKSRIKRKKLQTSEAAYKGLSWRSAYSISTKSGLLLLTPVCEVEEAVHFGTTWSHLCLTPKHSEVMQHTLGFDSENAIT
jgi:hypothetical protein